MFFSIIIGQDITMVKPRESLIRETIFLLVAVCFAISQELQPPFEKTIWMYIQQANDINQLQRLCISNIKQYGERSKYQVNIVSRQNISLFLNASQYPQQIGQSSFLDHKTLEKGLIQLSILEKYGGIWIDLPLILTETLEWINTLKNQKHINNRIDDIDAILFYTPEWFQSTHKRSVGKIEDLVVYPLYQTWFMGIRKESQFIKDCKRLFADIIKKSHSQFKSFNAEYDLNPQQFLLNPKHFLTWIVRSTIKIKQAKFDRQFGTSQSRRLAISYYKVSGVNTEQTAYLLSAEARDHTHLTAKYFSEVPLTNLNQKISYVLKITQKVAEELAPLVDDDVPLIDHLHASVELFCDDAKVPYRHIVKQSVIDNYLLKNNPKSAIKTYQPQFIAHNCSAAYGSVLYELLMGYILPVVVFVIHFYVVRRMILIFKPQWGVSRRRMV